MKIKYLDWDSSFFNKKIGELEIDSSTSHFPELEYDLLYVKQKKNFKLEIPGYIELYNETKLRFCKTLESNTQAVDKRIFSALQCSNIKVKQIYDLALESGKESRFKLDKKFTKTAFNELYKRWVDNSLNQKIAKDVLVFCVQDEIKGFITYSITAQNGAIGLLSVSPQEQGKGLGAQLIVALEENLKRLEIKNLSVQTQEHNNTACKFYKKNGFKIIEKQIIKHYWKI